MPSMRALNVGLAALWLPAALLMLAGPLYMAWDRWAVVLNGHPVTLLTGAAVLLVGFVGLLWSLATLFATPDKPLRRTVARRLGLSLSAVVLVLGLLASGGLAWARPVPAQAKALDAMASTDTVKLVERPTWYEFVPSDKRVKETRPTPSPTPSPTAIPTPRPPAPPDYPIGVIFSPGSKIDARAYAAMLRPLAQAGIFVVVLDEPYGIALMPDRQVSAVIRRNPRVQTWVAAGHSMGGAEAARMVNDHDQISALLLWGATPMWPVKRNVPTLLISGSTDGLTTARDIEAAKPNLPRDTAYVQVKGADHAAFGDFGVLEGDGPMLGNRDAIQAKITSLSKDFVLAQRTS